MTTPASTPLTGPLHLERAPLPLRFRRARVAAVATVTPRYRRLVLEGPDLVGFDSPGADDHLRLLLPRPDGTLVLPEVTPDGPRVPDGVEPSPSREYTPVAWDPERGRLALELVVHPGGLASDWVERTTPGDEVAVGGPRGSQLLRGMPEAWLLAGDLTALPAVRRHLAAAGGAPAEVVLLAPHADDVQEVGLEPGQRLTWVVDEQAPGGRTDALVEALAEAVPRWAAAGDPARGFAFVAAEQSVVGPARAHLTPYDVGVAVVKGYWHRGDAAYHAPH